MSSHTWIVPPCIASYCVMNCSAYMLSLRLRFSPHSNYTLRCYAHNLTACTLSSACCDRWPDLWHCGVLINPSWRTFALFEGCAAAPPLPTIREPQNTQLAVAVSRLSQQWCVQEPSTSQLRSWRFWLHEVGRAPLLHCYLYSSINARIPRKLYVICD